MSDTHTKTFGQRYAEIADRMDAAYAERNRHALFSPLYEAADLAVQAVYADLRALNAEVQS